MSEKRPAMPVLHFEFSKLIVRRMIVIFLVHVLLTLGIVFFRYDAAPHAVSLMHATVPLYAVVFGGYFGKAGIENYQKIKNSIECDNAQSVPPDVTG